MAINFKHDNVSFVYNPELTGDVLVRLSKPDSENHDTLRVPVSSILEFVAEIVKDRKIKKIKSRDINILFD